MLPTVSNDTDDTQDAAILRDAWLEMTSSLPDAPADLIARQRFTEAALDLVEDVIARDQLVGWRLTFTSVGGPYGAILFARRSDGGTVEEIRQENDASLSMAIVDALRVWREKSTPTD
jgi:hypothetical protein